MPLFRLSNDAISRVELADFAGLGLSERGDLQRILRDHPEVISPETLIISEEFSSWDRGDRRIDLLGVDKQARLVVIELKRTRDDSLADLQALRYAAMVGQMTFDEAVETLRLYSIRRGREADARAELLQFFGWTDPSEGRFGEDVRIVVAALDFSPEVTSTVLWLNERDLDIRCVRLQPYRVADGILLDVSQIIPLPEAADYRIQVRQKQRETRTAAEQSADWTRYDVTTDAGIQGALFKREVVPAAVKQLVARRVSPDEIERAAARRIFERVDGEVDGDAFATELMRRRPNDPQIARRYFIRDEQLFRAQGNTYALSTTLSDQQIYSVI